MSLEGDAITNDDTDAPDVEALGRELGDAVASLPEYEAFEAAHREVQSSPKVQERISEFEQLRQEFAMARQTGEAGEEELRKVQTAQQDLHSHPVMADYLEAKDALQDRLESVNRAISEPLLVDFGGEAGGCCQD